LTRRVEDGERRAGEELRREEKGKRRRRGRL